MFFRSLFSFLLNVIGSGYRLGSSTFFTAGWALSYPRSLKTLRAASRMRLIVIVTTRQNLNRSSTRSVFLFILILLFRKSNWFIREGKRSQPQGRPWWCARSSSRSRFLESSSSSAAGAPPKSSDGRSSRGTGSSSEGCGRRPKSDPDAWTGSLTSCEQCWFETQPLLPSPFPPSTVSARNSACKRARQLRSQKDRTGGRDAAPFAYKESRYLSHRRDVVSRSRK